MYFCLTVWDNHTQCWHTLHHCSFEDVTSCLPVVLFGARNISKTPPHVRSCHTAAYCRIFCSHCFFSRAQQSITLNAVPAAAIACRTDQVLECRIAPNKFLGPQKICPPTIRTFITADMPCTGQINRVLVFIYQAELPDKSLWLFIRLKWEENESENLCDGICFP